jgi:hypothetical protein
MARGEKVGRGPIQLRAASVRVPLSAVILGWLGRTVGRAMLRALGQPVLWATLRVWGRLLAGRHGGPVALCNYNKRSSSSVVRLASFAPDLVPAVVRLADPQHLAPSIGVPPSLAASNGDYQLGGTRAR